MSEMITPKDIYGALKVQLGTRGYIDRIENPEDDDLASVTVDGVVDCVEIVKFITKRCHKRNS